MYWCPNCESELAEHEIKEGVCEYGLGTCPNCDNDVEVMGMYDHLGDPLDVNYIVEKSGDVKAGRVYLAIGGPNIWIDTEIKSVVGHWGATRIEAALSDSACVAVNDVLENWFEYV